MNESLHVDSELAQRVEQVRESIAQAARDCGRDPQEVTLLPVSKTHPAQRVAPIAECGVTMLGENRVLEAEEKAAQVNNPALRWSIIGHVQSNKIGRMARFASEIQSVDSVALVEKLNGRLREYDRHMDAYIQVNTSGEEQKHGIDAAQLPALVDAVAACDRLRLVGLMTVAENSPQEAVVRACFARLRDLRDAHCPGLGLSMGMSGDFRLAIAEGSTCVRIGSSIFGSRPSPA